MDHVDQVAVPVWEFESEARDFVSDWMNGNDLEPYDYRVIECENDGHATVEELSAAGLDDLLGDMAAPSPRRGMH
jgi:hypothetical protein